MSEGAQRPSRMVEAAGVEPASESTSSKDSTCMSSFVISQPAWKRGENRQPLSPKPSYHARFRAPGVASLLQ